MLITTIFYVRLRRGVETERGREGEVGGEREKEREMRAERYPDEDVDDDHARREDHGDVEERQPRGRVLHRASSSSCSINPLFRFGGGRRVRIRESSRFWRATTPETRQRALTRVDAIFGVFVHISGSAKHFSGQSERPKDVFCTRLFFAAVASTPCRGLSAWGAGSEHHSDEAAVVSMPSA